MVILKTAQQIDGIRKSCQIVAHVLSEIDKNIKPGVTTAYLNEMAEELCYEKGGTPAFKGYKGFPFALCSSRNEEIVHGFPSPVKLKEGEMLSLDFGVLYKGWYGDSAFTKAVGEVPVKTEKLIKVTWQCLMDGIGQAYTGNTLGDIGFAIQTRAEVYGFNVIREFVGHGIGKNLHEDPQVMNFGEPGKGLKLTEGMVIAIEPMVVMGSNEIHTMPDGWTTITKDHQLSAHWEHTIAVLSDGPEILTIRD